LFPHFAELDFNADLLLFLYRQLFELKIIYTLNGNKEPFDFNGIREMESLSRAKMNLFYENEITDFGLRIELNSLIILFLEKR
jgi:hypothetical protein